MKQIKKKLPEPKVKTKLRPNIAFGRNNYILLLIGIIVIIAGFLSLAKGSITLAPILLVVGYCVIIPLALLIKSGPSVKKAVTQQAQSKTGKPFTSSNK